MTVLEGIPNALFCMAVVFVVLIVLYIIIKIFSIVIEQFEKRGNANPNASAAIVPITLAEDEPELSCGELKLIRVDESTAAMIMAIVSDETEIPLKELCFKSITEKN